MISTIFIVFILLIFGVVLVVDLFFIIFVTRKTRTFLSRFLLNGDLKYTICGPIHHYRLWKEHSGALHMRMINNKLKFKMYISPLIGWNLLCNKADDEDWCVLYHEIGHYLFDRMMYYTSQDSWFEKEIWSVLDKAFFESYANYDDDVWTITTDIVMYHAVYYDQLEDPYTAIHELAANVCAGYIFYQKFGRLPNLELMQTDGMFIPKAYGYPELFAGLHQMMWGAQYAEKGCVLEFK